MKFYGDHTMAAARCLDLCTPTQLRGDPTLKMFLELRRIIVRASFPVFSTADADVWAVHDMSPTANGRSQCSW
jgi:hypothetical protein